MNLTSPSSVRSILDQLDVIPSKARGQNFLIDRNILDIIMSVAAIQADDCVLEIGPGLGVVTGELLGKARHVVAVEIDSRFCAYLAERFKAAENLQLICGDALDLDLAALPDAGRQKVVANLPYSVASRVLVNLAESAAPPPAVVTTIQLEVANRLTAGPGSKDYGALSIWVQAVYDVAIRKVVSSTCFWPRPGVESAVVSMKKRNDGAFVLKDRKLFHLVVKYSFMQRRKQLASTLARIPEFATTSPGEWRQELEKLGIDSCARPEDLAISEWCQLADVASSLHPERK
ncbi:MAG: 16S rRNA (adenine(1518)-N(6)/adenine(1519)-N(6))-dimethyltransferase RsmA [bacterium]